MLPTEVAHASLAQSSREISRVLLEGDLAARVRACPGWDLAALVRHVGSVHRWATSCVETGLLPDHPRTDSGPDGRRELLSWFEEGSTRLQVALASVDPQRPTWTFGPDPQVAAFWSRRQAQETLIHAWDAQASQGEQLLIDTAMALDGIDEIATVLFPRQVRLGRTPALEQSLAVVPDEFESARFVFSSDGTEKPAHTDATLRGSAADLLLILWSRQPITKVEVIGDRSAAEQVLAAAITP